MPTHHDAVSFLENSCGWMFNLRRRRLDSMLYVGHRWDTKNWWCTAFRELIGCTRIAVIDIQEPNLRTAESITSDLILGDVRTHPRVASFDLIFWDEGPEHVPKEEALSLLQGLPTVCSVLISCPWGHQPQGSGPDDPEFHHWAPQPEDFTAIGYEARTFGEMFDGRGGGHGNLIAWRT